MTIQKPDIPSVEHYGLWWNFFGDVIKYKLQTTDSKYINLVNDEEIEFWDEELALSQPHIYIVPQSEEVKEGGMFPIILEGEGLFRYLIIVESYDPNRILAKKEATLIVGDIIGMLANDRQLTLDTTRTARNLEFDAFDPIFVKAETEAEDFYVWASVEIVVWKKLTLPATVT